MLEKKVVLDTQYDMALCVRHRALGLLFDIFEVSQCVQRQNLDRLSISVLFEDRDLLKLT